MKSWWVMKTSEPPGQDPAVPIPGTHILYREALLPQLGDLRQPGQASGPCVVHLAGGPYSLPGKQEPEDSPGGGQHRADRSATSSQPQEVDSGALSQDGGLGKAMVRDSSSKRAHAVGRSHLLCQGCGDLRAGLVVALGAQILAGSMCPWKNPSTPDPATQADQLQWGIQSLLGLFPHLCTADTISVSWAV
jgi:hypothetical protein